MGFKRLFFDIEVSYCEGWFWRPSYKTSISYDQVFKVSEIICICWKWQGSDKIYSLEWDKNQSDKAMVKKFIEVIKDADEVVGHNGDRFDIKWFRTRCLYHGVKSLPSIKSIDTLKISRTKFNFPSNRLDFIGKYLGLGGKRETGGIELWHDIIKRKSKKSMKKMIAYCKRDVELLEQVFLKLEGFSTHKTHIALQEGSKDKCDCPYCASEKTYLDSRKISAKGIVSIGMQCQSCKKYFSISQQAYNSR